MTKVIMGIGISGAGKTTFLRKYAHAHALHFIEIDAVKTEQGLPYGIATPPYIWDIVRKRAQEILAKDESLVLDTTLLSPDLNRRELLEFLKKSGAQKIHGIFFNTPKDIAWRRNVSRGRGSSREVFERGVAVLKENPPRKDEFDEYTVLEVGKN